MQRASRNLLIAFPVLSQYYATVLSLQATQSTQPPNVLDLSGGGRASLGEALVQHASSAFAVRVLRMCNNALSTLPPQTWSLQALTHLDISDNRITELPAEICRLTQ